MDQKTMDDLKKKLESQRESIIKELENFASEDPNLKHNWDAKYPKREDSDKDEKADDAQEYDNALSLEHTLELKLKDVTMALEKIEKGEYGICEVCGKTISEERLQVCPEAKTCLKCHQK